MINKNQFLPKKLLSLLLLFVNLSFTMDVPLDPIDPIASIELNKDGISISLKKQPDKFSSSIKKNIEIFSLSDLGMLINVPVSEQQSYPITIDKNSWIILQTKENDKDINLYIKKDLALMCGTIKEFMESFSQQITTGVTLPIIPIDQCNNETLKAIFNSCIHYKRGEFQKIIDPLISLDQMLLMLDCSSKLLFPLRLLPFYIQNIIKYYESSWEQQRFNYTQLDTLSAELQSSLKKQLYLELKKNTLTIK